MNQLRRIPSVFVWAIGILAAILSIVGVLWPWCAVLAGLLTIVIVSVQYKTQGSITVKFTTSDWTPSGDDFQFSAGRHHGKGRKPSATVYMPLATGGYEEVVCDVHTFETGEVVIHAARPFEGEVRIN